MAGNNDKITTVTAHCPKCIRPTIHVQVVDGTFKCKTCLQRDDERLADIIAPGWRNQ